MYRTTFHDDGSVTYWSVCAQVWVRNVYYVSDSELATWSAEERARFEDIRAARRLARDLMLEIIYRGGEYEGALGFGDNATGMGFAISTQGVLDCSRMAVDVRRRIASSPETARERAMLYLESARSLQAIPDEDGLRPSLHREAELRSALWRAVDAACLLASLAAAATAPSAEPSTEDEPFMYEYPEGD